MLVVVKLHNLAGNHRLKSLVAVRQLGKSVLLANNIACGPSCLSGGTQETSVGQHSAGIEVKVHPTTAQYSTLWPHKPHPPARLKTVACDTKHAIAFQKKSSKWLDINTFLLEKETYE